MLRITRSFLCLFLLCAAGHAYASNMVDSPYIPNTIVIAQADNENDIELPKLPGTPPPPAVPSLDVPKLPTLEENVKTDKKLPTPPMLIPPSIDGTTDAPSLPLPTLPETSDSATEKSQPFDTNTFLEDDEEEKQQPFSTEETEEKALTPTPDQDPEKPAAATECSEIPDAILACTPTKCSHDTADGQENYTITGMDENFCKFTYSTPHISEAKECYLSENGRKVMATGIKLLLETGNESTDSTFTDVVSKECGTPTPAETTTKKEPEPVAPAEETAPPPPPASPSDKTSLGIPELDNKKQSAMNNCSALPDKLDQCSHFKCKEQAYDENQSTFTKTRSITGAEEGLCRYQETLPDNFTLDCNLSKKHSSNFASYFRLLRTPEKASQQPDTITTYYDTMESACKVIGDDGKELSMELYFSLSNLPTKIMDYGSKSSPTGDCETLNEKLKTCEPFYCKGFDPVQEKFFNRQVEIERKIIGPRDNICYYLEQKPDGKPQGCKYASAQSSTTSQCSTAILLEMTKIEGMFAKTAAEQAADVKKKEIEKNKPKGEQDPTLTMWKPKLKELPNLNYKTQVLPELIYKKQYDKQNQDLPKAMYLNDYRALAFQALSQGDLTTLRALTHKIDEIYSQMPHDTDAEKATGKKKRPLNGLEIRDNNGNTLLVRSIMAGRFTAARMLLGEGANPNAQNNSGNTALHVAAYAGRLDMVNLLLDMGADRNIKDHYGRTALTLAAEQKHNDISQILLMKGGNPNLAMSDGMTPLITVIEQNNEQAVLRLIKSGADVNLPDANGQTPLMHAANLGYARIVDILVNNGANLFTQDRTGLTAEMYAARGGFTYISRHLANLAIDARLHKASTHIPH